VPHWGEVDLTAGVHRDTSPLIDDVDAHYAWSREAARFAVILGLLLDAEGAPLAPRDERETKQRTRGSAVQPREWVTRHLYLDEVRPASAAGASGTGDPGAEGRLPEEVIVRGHLKRQRHGAGRSEVRWIYVASYEARRWVAPRPVRIVVDQ